MMVGEQAVHAGTPTARREAWFVRSITPAELPAACPYCRRRGREIQAVAVIGFRLLDVYPSGIEMVKGERASPACVDHGVYVQQKYVFPRDTDQR